MTNFTLTEGVSNIPKPFSYQNNQFIIPNKTVRHEPIILEVSDERIHQLDIKVGDLSEVKIILNLKSDLVDQKTIQVHLECGRASIVKYVLITELKSTKGHLNHKISVLKDAQLAFYAGMINDQFKGELTMNLLEEGASVNLKSLTLSHHKNHQVVDAHIVHYAKNTYGDMTNIGIVNDQATIVLNGVGKIEKAMKNANAYQTLKGIILSDQAVCEVNPVLIIDEFDVKAGHGATVGKIEENQLYYLMSRGLSQKEAERLIIGGFIQPIIDEIDDDVIKERFINLANERI